MSIEFEFNGFWWFPDKPENKFSGTLTFKTDIGAILKLSGKFDDKSDGPDNVDFILGIVERGKHITLHNCINSSDYYWSGYLPFKFRYYKAWHIFIGEHFLKKEEIVFNKLMFNFQWLDAWVNISGFWVGHYYKNGYKVGISKHKDISAVISNEWKTKIEIFPIIHMKGSEEWGIKQETYITVEPSSSKSLSECIEIINNFRQLFSFVFLEPSYPINIKGFTKTQKETLNGTDYNNPIEIIPFEFYYKMPDRIKKLDYLPIYKMLFKLDDIVKRFDNFLNIWFNKINNLKACINLYLASIYNPELYIEHNFLDMIHAIEVYHRHSYNYLVISPAELSILIKNIFSSTEDKYHKILNNKLQYASEPSLLMRLRDIVNKNKTIYKLLGNKKEINKFLRKVINTRNYLTHYDKKKEKSSAKGNELIELTKKLKIIFEMCFLKEMDFQESEIEKIVLRNPSYKHFLNDHSDLPQTAKNIDPSLRSG